MRTRTCAIAGAMLIAGSLSLAAVAGQGAGASPSAHAALTLSWSPTNTGTGYAFGTVTGPVTRTFTLTSTASHSDRPVPLASPLAVGLTASPGSGFAITATTCGGGSTSPTCTVTVELTPSPGTTSYSATLTASSRPSTASITLSGSAAQTAPVAIATTPGPGGVVGATTITDSATLSGGSDPSGTISFDLYSQTCFSNPVYTDVVVVNNDGSYDTSAGSNPGGYLATSTGTYYWIAAYSGDNANFSVSSGCGEPVVITAASPAISTIQQPVSATVGSSVADSAALSGGDSPTGTVTFTLYDNPDGTGTPLFTDTEPLAGGVATSKGYTTTAVGTDYWVATYNGDTNNQPVSSGPSDEPVTIVSKVTPAITATASPAFVSGGGFTVRARATVSGGDSPTGTVTFDLYTDATCTGTPLFSDTESLSGGTATSSSFTGTADGTTDYWVATYNGDANNSPVSSACNSAPVTTGQ